MPSGKWAAGWQVGGAAPTMGMDVVAWAGGWHAGGVGPTLGLDVVVWGAGRQVGCPAGGKRVVRGQPSV
jgi:hypothetical protein